MFNYHFNFSIIYFFACYFIKIKNTLNGFLEKLNLGSLHQLKSPSEKHQYDGAMYTTIEVVWDNKTYKSVGFDDDNPPKELIPFLHYLVALVK